MTSTSANAAGRNSIGLHTDSEDPVATAVTRGAEVVQIFLGDPQGWKKPQPHPRADELRAAPQDAGVTVFVHAPYVVNVATGNNRIRIPSRKILDQHAEAAAGIGAAGLIVHGGHVLAADDPQSGFDNWRKVFARAQESGGFPLPVLIENTAGGDHSMARRLESIARLWDAVGEYDVGFCLDTCHAHAGGIELGTVVEKILGITGRIDLVHCNDSRDDFDSGRDRHATIGKGRIDPSDLVAVIEQVDCPVVVETPGEHQAEDIAYLREHLAQG